MRIDFAKLGKAIAGFGVGGASLYLTQYAPDKLKAIPMVAGFGGIGYGGWELYQTFKPKPPTPPETPTKEEAKKLEINIIDPEVNEVHKPDPRTGIVTVWHRIKIYNPMDKKFVFYIQPRLKDPEGTIHWFKDGYWKVTINPSSTRKFPAWWKVPLKLHIRPRDVMPGTWKIEDNIWTEPFPEGKYLRSTGWQNFKIKTGWK